MWPQEPSNLIHHPRKADGVFSSQHCADSLSASFSGGSGDAVVYTVDLPESGFWYLWARMYYPGDLGSNQANSFLVSIDGGQALKLGNNRDYFQRWHWDGNGQIESGATAALPLGTLDTGPHELKVEKREVSPIQPRIDVLVLSTDPTFVPFDSEAVAAFGKRGFALLVTPGPDTVLIPGEVIGGAEIVTYEKSGDVLTIVRYLETRQIHASYVLFVPMHTYRSPDPPAASSPAAASQAGDLVGRGEDDGRAATAFDPGGEAGALAVTLRRGGGEVRGVLGQAIVHDHDGAAHSRAVVMRATRPSIMSKNIPTKMSIPAAER